MALLQQAYKTNASRCLVSAYIQSGRADRHPSETARVAAITITTLTLLQPAGTGIASDTNSTPRAALLATYINGERVCCGTAAHTSVFLPSKLRFPFLPAGRQRRGSRSLGHRRHRHFTSSSPFRGVCAKPLPVVLMGEVTPPKQNQPRPVPSLVNAIRVACQQRA